MSPDSSEQRFAFFDLDLTLVPYDTQLLFCNHVIRAEPWRRLYLFVFAPFAVLYGLKLLDDRQMKRIFLSYLWRMPRARVERYAESFVEEVVSPMLYPEVVAELERHRSEGRVTVLNSASPDFYVGAIARRLGFDHWFGTRVTAGERLAFLPEIPAPNNKGGAKIDAMREILPQAAGGSLGDSYAYSDSSADLPMLLLAEHAVMVHPSSRLRAEGERRGWPELKPARPYGGKAGRILACLRQVLGLWRAA